jgi:two-component system nitrogen regulation sensor histidine kinase NtrY
VIDNGIGLPKQNRGRLVEPYVTTRAKGTGLGLAIVQKIVGEHGGSLALEDAPPDADGSERRGAMIRIRLPIRTAPKAETRGEGAPVVSGAAAAAVH